MYFFFHFPSNKTLVKVSYRRSFLLWCHLLASLHKVFPAPPTVIFHSCATSFPLALSGIPQISIKSNQSTFLWCSTNQSKVSCAFTPSLYFVTLITFGFSLLHHKPQSLSVCLTVTMQANAFQPWSLKPRSLPVCIQWASHVWLKNQQGNGSWRHLMFAECLVSVTCVTFVSVFSTLRWDYFSRNSLCVLMWGIPLWMYVNAYIFINTWHI